MFKRNLTGGPFSHPVSYGSRQRGFLVTQYVKTSWTEELTMILISHKQMVIKGTQHIVNNSIKFAEMLATFSDIVDGKNSAQTC